MNAMAYTLVIILLNRLALESHPWYYSITILTGDKNLLADSDNMQPIPLLVYRRRPRRSQYTPHQRRPIIYGGTTDRL